jgi:very-short-patch-repair endonuclease
MFELPHQVMADQHALVTTHQLREAGFDRDGRRWLVEGGQLAPVTPRVLRLLGAPQTAAQRVLAAVLDAGPGAALSHTAALAWWGVPGFTLRDLHVTHPPPGPPRRGRPPDVTTHGRELPADDVRVLDSVPVVAPARALFDLAGMRGVPPARVERAVDNAWSLRLVSGRTLRAMLDRLARPGRSGVGVMRALLAERGLDYVPPASGLEARLHDILQGRWRTSLRQVDVGDEDGWIGRVDFADPELPFVLEVQSERFHGSLLDARADRERKARLEAAGFVVVEVADVDVWHHPDHVVEQVRRGRNEAQLRVLRRTGGRLRDDAPGSAPPPSSSGAGVVAEEGPVVGATR